MQTETKEEVAGSTPKEEAPVDDWEDWEDNLAEKVAEVSIEEKPTPEPAPVAAAPATITTTTAVKVCFVSD